MLSSEGDGRGRGEGEVGRREVLFVYTCCGMLAGLFCSVFLRYDDKFASLLFHFLLFFTSCLLLPFSFSDGMAFVSFLSLSFIFIFYFFFI